MSVILQPYQVLPFSTSLDFQVSRSGGSLCTYNNLIDSAAFVPFAILSDSETIGEINVFDCDDVFVQSLTLVISSVQDVETGLWFHYYNGDSLGLSCGTYYLTILVGDFIWYSEQFTIRDITDTSIYPELIKDDYHLPLRIYDSIVKQLNNKISIGCNVQPLNPVSTIMPFMFDTDEDINDIDVFMVDACSGEEIDISADLELEFIKENPGALVDEDVLTTSQQLRNEFYMFPQPNYIFQEFKINDTGILKDITFEWYFGGEAQIITADLILGTNPSGTVVSSKNISDTSSTSKDITIDYSSDAINVTAGEIYILKLRTSAETCTCGVGVNSTKIYLDGQFAERNYLGEFKDNINTTVTDNYTNGGSKYATFGTPLGYQCYGDSLYPSNPATYSYRYTANEDQPVRIRTSDFSFHVVAAVLVPVRVYFKIKHGAYELYSFDNIYSSIQDVNIPDQVVYAQLLTGENISIECYMALVAGGSIDSSYFNLNGSVWVDVYKYGVVLEGLQVWLPTGFVPVGINYQNKSMWFLVNVTKQVYVGGTGDTIIYNPGRPMPSPLICGNYYLKLVSDLHTWYSEWFRVINVGAVDLTRYVLGTEDGEILVTEDSEIIEI